MARRVYRVEELLMLRRNQSCSRLAFLAKQGSDLADIVRNPQPEMAKPDTDHKKAKDTSSEMSEEVIYKGNGNRHVANEETEWKYRGRSGSEATTNEPLSAPAGLNAQQSEGFQKFYRAVISPNHVRVTAGGRIVPNTRNPSSPTAKRPRDRGIPDGHNPPPGHVPAMGGLGQFPMQPVFPPMFPSFAQAHTPVPFMPMTFGFPMPAGLPVMHPAAVAPPGLQSLSPHDGTLRDTHNTKAPETHGGQDPNSDKESKVKVPSAESADPPKAFMYNGQWMTPLAPHLQAQGPFGGPFIPLNMLANPNFPVSNMQGHMISHPPVAMSPMTSQVSFQPGQPPSSGFPGLTNSSLPGVCAFPAPATPPMSSIRPSEITKNQLQQLRGSLKYNEDQLHYNRHQIDEKGMGEKIRGLQEQIQRFESTLTLQLAHEETFYPKPAKSQEPNTVSATLSSHQIEPVSNLMESQPGTKAGSPSADVTPYTVAHRKRDTSRHRPNLNVESCSGGEVTFQFDPTVTTSEFVDPVKKSALPSGAALAPPFKPGASPLLSNITTIQSGSVSGPQFVPRSTNGLGSVGGSAVSRPAQQGFDALSVSSKSRNAYAASGSPKGSGEDEPEQFGLPYLVGTLPAGVDPETAVDTDYMYPRRLTQDEVRSRFLHWGGAPRSARRGLPKYDGRNFYASSPTEDAAIPDSPVLRNSEVSTDWPEADRGYRIAKAALDPFQSRSADDPPVSFQGSTAKLEGKSIRRYHSFRSQIDSSSDDLQKALESSSAFDDVPVESSTTSEIDPKPVEAQEKRMDRTGVKLWQAMLKKVPSSSAVSATTAQGSRPQYTGHAAASLSPTMTNAVVSPGRHMSPGKTADDGGGGASLTPVPDKRGENCPPPGSGSLEEHFRALAIGESKQRTGFSPSWK